MRFRGLTYKQVLGVLAFLAVIAFILFPVFARSREKPGHHSCQSNLKQITLAFKQYLQDSNEVFPRYDIRNVGSTTWGSLSGTHWVQSLQPYTKSVMIFQCPSDWPELGTDYFYNRNVSGHSEGSFKNSANTVLLTEGTDTADASQATATSPITVGDPPSYVRHLEGSNYAFVDGHVKWLSSAKAPGNQPAAKGRFTFSP